MANRIIRFEDEEDVPIFPVTNRIDWKLRRKNIATINAELKKKPGLVLVIIREKDRNSGHRHGCFGYSFATYTTTLVLGLPEGNKLVPVGGLPTNIYYLAGKAVAVRRSDHHTSPRLLPNLFVEYGMHPDHEFVSCWVTLEDLDVTTGRSFHLTPEYRLQFIYGREAIDAWFTTEEEFKVQNTLYRKLGIEPVSTPEFLAYRQGKLKDALLTTLNAFMEGGAALKKVKKTMELGKQGQGGDPDALIDEFAAMLMSRGDRETYQRRQAAIRQTVAELEEIGIPAKEFWCAFSAGVTKLVQDFAASSSTQ